MCVDGTLQKQLIDSFSCQIKQFIKQGIIWLTQFLC